MFSLFSEPEVRTPDDTASDFSAPLEPEFPFAPQADITIIMASSNEAAAIPLLPILFLVFLALLPDLFTDSTLLQYFQSYLDLARHLLNFCASMADNSKNNSISEIVPPGGILT